MSMNGVDYTKQLAKDREYYQDANKKLRDATEKRVESTDKRADHVMTKQRENFIEDKAVLESSYQKNLDHLKEKTQASLDGNSKKFNEDLVKERESFTLDSIKKRKDFDQRLNDIKSSYSKSLESETTRNQELNKFNKSKFDRNVTNLRTDSEVKMKGLQDTISKKATDIKDQSDKERQQLVRTQENRLTDATKLAAQQRLDFKNKIETDARRTKASHQSEIAQQKQYSDERIKSVNNKYQDRFETMSKDYSMKTEDLVEAQQRESNKANIEHKEQLTDVRREFNDDFRRIKLEKRREEPGSGDFAEVVNKQQGLKDELIHKNQLNQVKDQLVDAQRSYQKRADKDQVAFNDTLRDQASEGVAREERRLKEANAHKIMSVSHEREKAEKQVSNREDQNRLDRSAFETQLMNEKNSGNERLVKLKESFAASMKTLEEKHKAGMEDVSKISIKDRSDFMKKTEQTRSEEIFEIKRSFGKLMDATIQDYEQRLATYQRDNEYLKMSMDQKVHNIMDQTEKQLETQRTLFEDRRSADVKGQQLLMDQRESQLKKNFSEMNLAYQKKIDKMQLEGESKIKLITNDYETKLRELKALTSKELASKETDKQIELDRIKQSYEAEKTRIVSAYESQIDAMKQGHKEQLDQMAGYKRLS